MFPGLGNSAMVTFLGRFFCDPFKVGLLVTSNYEIKRSRKAESPGGTKITLPAFRTKVEIRNNLGTLPETNIAPENRPSQ